jgi:Putative beta-barrel porin 2
LSLVALSAGWAGSASAQGFRDYETIGRLEDERREPTVLSIEGHEFEPTLNYKLFGVTTPHVVGAVGGGYDDNLLRADSDTPGVKLRRELFGRAAAGVRLDTEIADHRIELGYVGRVTEYEGSGQFDTLEQLARGRFDFFFTDLELHADARWSRLAYPQSIQLVGIVNLDVYQADVWTEARLGRFGVRVGLEGSVRDYRDTELDFLDADRGAIKAQFYGRIQPKLRGLVEYNLALVTYRDGRATTVNDSLTHVLWVGVDGELTPKITASLKVGYAYQDVRVNSNPDRREYRNVVAAGSVQWEPWIATTFVLAYRRPLEGSTTSNYLISHEVEARAQQTLYDEKITLLASFIYTRSHVLPGENLNRIQARAEAGWKIRDWLSVRGSYAFVKLNSEFPDSDYAQHVVTISVGVGF